MQGFYTNVAQARGNILIRGYDEGGKRIQRTVPYKPYLFIESNKESEFTTLDGKSVSRIDFDSMKDARDFTNRYKDVGGMKFYGMTNYIYPFIYDHFPRDFKYDISLISVVGIDIEVDIDGKGFPDIQLADNEITLITISRNRQKVVFGCGEFTPPTEDVTYYKFKDEATMLKAFLKVWNSPSFSPDIVTGWNIEMFDIPYIINRITRILGQDFAKKLSPWNILNESSVFIQGREIQIYTPVGITILDYLPLYKKFGYTQQESYSLGHVASEELGEGKLDYGEYGSLAELQRRNFQLYAEYNVKDVDLVDRLDDKLKLIALVIAMAYDARVNFQDTFTTVRLWDVLIHNYLLDRNIVIPQYEKPEHDRSIVGGYVKDPQVGFHNWVVSLDLASLYPHIVIQYNISPETYRGMLPAHLSLDDILSGKMNTYADFLQKENVAVTANCLLFDRSKKGFLPAIMQKIYDDRVVYKNKMLESQQKYEQVQEELRRRGLLDK